MNDLFAKNFECGKMKLQRGGLEMGKRLVIFGIVLLLAVNVFAQQVNVYKESDEVLLENVEKYLNSISFF